ncbi:MAG TPA: UDP-N-acetylmuramoyl-tripeptide--D-alanyl-D-alanine ligase [Rubrivivax sp.]
MMTLAHAHALLPGSLLVGDPSVEFTRIHSDTRTLRTGDLFVALRGERIDANDFLPQARDAGAVAALAQRGLAEAGLPGLQVVDTLLALQTLAGAWRHRFHLPLIAVAGSNGKTTVTQMIASVLRAWLGTGAFATEGNFNNHIGVPLTLLRLRQDDTAWHRAGVVELGMNHPGEIALLARLSAPTVALVNNAQREHQEFMASVEAVALENGAVIEALGPAGTAVFPADDAQAAVWRRQAGARPMISFALEGPADVTADAVWQQGGWAVRLRTPAGEAALTLQLAGRHNVRNALASTAAALAAGVPLEAIVRGLESFVPVKGRSQVGTVVLHGRDAVLVDDSYNANPDSVLAAIDVLASLPAPRWLVLGDMGEVGTQGPQFHAEVGTAASARGIDHFWCAGAMSAGAARAYGAGARHFDTGEALIAALPQAPQAASVLVKGSRFMKMERVVQALQTKGGHDVA